MARGDVVADLVGAVADNAAVTVQPGASIEWVIHNIYAEGVIELATVEGAIEVIFYRSTTGVTRDWVAGAQIHLNNTNFLKIYNRNGAALDISYDGVQTK